MTSLDDFYAHVDLLFRDGKSEELEQYMLGFLQDLEDRSILGPSSGGSDAVAVLNELASWYRGVSRYDEAAHYYEEALARVRAAGEESSPVAARILLNLAGTYRYQGRLELAEPLFLQVKELMEAQGIPDRYAYAATVNNLSLVYQAQERFDEALSLQCENLDFLKDCEGADEHEIATTLVNSSNIFIRLGRYAEAEEAVDEAIALFEAMPKTNVHLGSAYSAKATLLFKRGETEASREAFEKAAELNKRFFGENTDYAIVLCSLAKNCEALGDIGAARAHLTHAIGLLEKQLGPDDARVCAYREYLDELQERSAADADDAGHR